MMKRSIIDNYIPKDPITPLTRTTFSSKSNYRIKLNRSTFTKNLNLIVLDTSRKEGDFNLNLDTEPQLEGESGEESRFSNIKPHTTTAASRFKPNLTPDPLSDVVEKAKIRKVKTTSEPAGGMGLTVTSDTGNKIEEFRVANRISLDTYTKPGHYRHMKQLSNITKETAASYSTKSKSSMGSLPKLQVKEQPPKIKQPARALKKTKSLVTTKAKPKVEPDNTNLNLLLDLQTDPLFKSVYTPSFFATNFPITTTYYDDIRGYRFDSYNVKVPSLLISDKL